jgi:recombination protein RecR
MAFHLLERDRPGAARLANALLEAMQKVGHCKSCRTFSEDDLCSLCTNARRDRGLLCIVESPPDLFAIDQGTDFSGCFFVLMGRLSPLDGIGPEELGLDALSRRLGEGEVTEVIIATSATVEGEATSHYISEMCRRNSIRVTRIAQGIPIGGELEFVDGGTLSHALSGRREI